MKKGSNDGHCLKTNLRWRKSDVNTIPYVGEKRCTKSADSRQILDRRVSARRPMSDAALDFPRTEQTYPSLDLGGASLGTLTLATANFLLASAAACDSLSTADMREVMLRTASFKFV